MPKIRSLLSRSGVVLLDGGLDVFGLQCKALAQVNGGPGAENRALIDRGAKAIRGSTNVGQLIISGPTYGTPHEMKMRVGHEIMGGIEGISMEEIMGNMIPVFSGPGKVRGMLLFTDSSQQCMQIWDILDKRSVVTGDRMVGAFKVALAPCNCG